jgi:hypothetical protein
MRQALPLLLLLVLIYTLKNKQMGQAHQPRYSDRAQMWAMGGCGAVMGFYDGFFGPGTGSLLVFLLVRILGFDFLQASAHSKVLNLASNMAALLWLGWQGHVLWAIFLPMALANIAGSLVVGSAVSQYRSKMILALMYASRAALVLWYLWMPKTDLTFYLFAAGLGLTWLATVPPTAALVGKLFGIRYMGTLFGMTLLSHQIGGFLGAWLGGLAITHQGDYAWMWYADIALAVAAALLNLPIKEAPVRQTAAA